MSHHPHLPVWAQILLEERRNDPRSLGISFNADDLQHEDEVIEIPAYRGPARECLVLMAHGSRDARWRGTFECLHASVRARFGDHVKLAYMEFVGPTLMDVARECHADGVRYMKVLPLFMAGGAHVATDIPEQVAEVREQFPAMFVQIEAPIGEDPRMFAVIQEIIGEHARGDSGSRLGAA